MFVEEKSDPSKNPSEPPLPSTEWDESSLAKLVGLDDDEYSLSESLGPTATSSSSDSSPDSLSNGDAALTQGNVLEDDELFDDPHLGATPPTVAKSPFAKLGLVAGGLGVVFLVGGLLVQGIMNPKGELKAKNPAPTPTPTVEAHSQENTEGQLKTQLALNSQSDELKQLDEAKKNQKKQKVSPTDPNRQKALDGKTPSPTPRNEAAPTTASVSRPKTYSSPPVQERISSPPVRKAPALAPAAPVSSSLAQVARLAPSPPTPTKIQTPTTPKPSPSPTSVASTPAIPKVDAMTQWQTLASLGSYSAPSSDEPDVGASEASLQQGQQLKKAESAVTSASQPQQTSPQAAPAAFSPQQAEQRLLNGTPYRVAASGSMADGVLSTPAIVPTDSKEASRVVVTLSSALSDTSGQIVMPAGTSLVFEVRGIDGNGVMNAVAVSQLDNTGMEKALPSDAIVLTGEKGSPLIAKGYFDNGGTIASMDISTAVLGALGKFGEILNRPKEQTSSSISDGSLSQTTTSTTGKPNLLGALLEGGANPVLEQIAKRNERAIQDMQQRKNLWFLEAGTRVQILVNRSFEL